MKLSKKSTVRKCKGCGKTLSIDKNDLAYTPNLDFEYCQRCFKLKHYGENTNVNESKLVTQDILNKIQISDLHWVVIVNDIVNIDFDVIQKYKNHTNIIYIFNKCDLIVTDKNRVNIWNNLTKLLEEKGIFDSEIFLTSTVSNLGIKKLCDFIYKTNWNEKFYFIGQTNSGKSSLINKLIKESGSRSKPLTISNFLNTTIDMKKVNILKHDVIDTPGYNSDKNILLKMNKDKDVRDVLTKQKYKSRSYQLIGKQTLFLNNLAYVSTESNEKCSVTFFTSNAIDIQRVKTENIDKNLKNEKLNKFDLKNDSRTTREFVLDDKQKYNLVICGLGLLNIKGCNKISVNTYEDVSVELLNGVVI